MVSLRRLRTPRAAAILVAVCAIVHLAAAQWEAWRSDAAASESNAARWIKKYEPLRAWLSDDQLARFQVVQNAERDSLHRDARLYLARFAVAPKRLAFDADSPLLIVDSDDPARELPPDGFALLKDFGDGLRLYRVAAERKR